MKSGNPPQGTRRREAADRAMGLSEGQMTGTSGLEHISTRQRKLAELAQQDPQLELTTIAHHIDLVWLREAYRRTRKDGAAGVDGVTAAQYEADLEANLSSLLERFKSGLYRAPPVRRVHIPKPGKAGEDETVRHPDAGGQGLAARGADGAGADLRAGLCGLFVRVPARTRRAPGAGGAVGRADVAGRWLGDRSGHPELLRRGGSGPSKGLSGPTGARRSDPTRDRASG